MVTMVAAPQQQQQQQPYATGMQQQPYATGMQQNQQTQQQNAYAANTMV